jgi:MFS transporter, FHS family, L-fucose permease
MATIGGKTLENQGVNTSRSGGYLLPLAIIASLFFIFGFVTWVNGTLIPYLKIACELNEFQSYLVAFAFYIAYFIMAIPSSWVLDKVGYKRGMSLGLLIMAIGSVIFIPAAQSRNYSFFLVGLFCQGIGLALLQTASNPYVTILGPLESAAQRISIMGICNKVAGALGSIILAQILLEGFDEMNAQMVTMSAAEKAVILDQMAARVINPYIYISIAFAVVAVLLNFSPLPEIDTNKTTTDDQSVISVQKDSIFQYTYLFLGAAALFLYVGAEVIAGDSIINYGINYWNIPVDRAKFFTSFTLASMIVGYLLGVALIPKYLSQETALKICSVLGVVLTLGIVVTSGFTSVLFVAALGFANSLVWPAIWPLAIKDLGKYTKTGSAILVMAIAGGAILPLFYGLLADKNLLGSQQAYWIMMPCYLFMLFFAVKGHKMGTVEKKTSNLNGSTKHPLNESIKPSKNGKVLDSVLE